MIFGTHGYYVVVPATGGRAASGSAPTIDYLDRSEPNPFNPTTRIRFALNRGAEVSLRIYSVTGRVVRTLHQGPLSRGEHEFVWDGRAAGGAPVASGLYFYELRAGGERATGKMLAVK